MENITNTVQCDPPSSVVQAEAPAQQVPAVPELTDDQLEAIEYLVAGHSYSQTAKALEIDPSTLYRWRQSPAFMAELNLWRAAAYDETRDRLLRMSNNAIAEVERRMMHVDPLKMLRVINLFAKPLEMSARPPRPQPAAAPSDGNA